MGNEGFLATLILTCFGAGGITAQVGKWIVEELRRRRAEKQGRLDELDNTRAELEEWRARAYECRIVGMQAGAPLYKFPMFPGEKHDDLREVHDDRS